jgi:hypothetical protein
MPTGFESWADASLVPGAEVVMVKLYGVHTGATLRQWRAEIGAVWGRHCRAYVIDYRKCVLAAAHDELASMQLDALSAIPGAVICSDAQYPAFLAMTQALGSLGVLRVPFVDEGSAIRWARVCCLMTPQEAGEQSPPRFRPSSAVCARA